MMTPLLCALIVLMALQVFWISVTFYHTGRLRDLILPVLFVIITALVISFLRLLNESGNEQVIAGIRISAGSPFPCIFACGTLTVITAAFLITELFRMSREITGASIKEGADMLPSGLLFYENSGIIIIANKTMYELAEKCLGKVLLSGELFFEELKKMPGADRFDGEKEIINLQLNDERNITFIKEQINVDGEMINQILAMDTTSLHELRKELQADNERLSAMNGMLRKYGESVTRLTREEEILSAKVRIHDNLGEALLATRYYLTQNRLPAAAANLVKTWERNISLLRRETVSEDMTDPMIQIINAGQTIGLLVIINGDLPKESLKVLRLINAAARECMTNSVKHAKATEMYIDIKEEGAFYTVSFSDNGKCSGKKVLMGGGLTSLNEQIKKACGVMETEIGEGFKLTIKIPG